MNDGKKYDKEKPDWSLVNLKIIEGIATALTHGEKKYGRTNYLKVKPRKYLAAMLRHLTSYSQGTKIDVDSGLPHLTLVMTNAHILQELESKGMELDLEK